jgi:hypothetical protein
LTVELANHVQVLGPGQHFLELAADHAGAGGDTEQTLGGGIDGTDPALCVDGDHPCVHVAQHDLHVSAALVEFGIGAFQARESLAEVVGHLIEGADQETDFVIGAGLDDDVQVSPRDLLGSLHQGVDGTRHSLRHAQPPPYGEEHDHQGEEQQDQLIDAGDPARKGLNRPVLLDGCANHADLVHQRVWNQVVHHHRAHHLLRAGGIRRIDRHGTSDHVADFGAGALDD